MAGLVAYDGSSSSSGEESDNEDLIQKPKTVTVTSTMTSKNSQPQSRGSSGSMISDRHDAFLLRFRELLPEPKTDDDIDMDMTPPVVSVPVEDIGPIPPKKIYGDEEAPPPPGVSTVTARVVGVGVDRRTEVTATRSAKGVMRINIPSLKEFEDDPEVESTQTKKFSGNGPKKGSGLFAILPEPKGASMTANATTTFLKTAGQTDQKLPASTGTATTTPSNSKPKPSSSFSLIPHAVQQSLAGKRPAEIPISEKLAQVRAKYMKTESNFKIVSKNKNKTKKNRNEDDDDDSSEEEDGPSDFFSLDESKNPVDLTSVNLDDYRVSIEDEDVAGDSNAMEVDDQGPGASSEPLPTPTFADSTPATQQDDLMKYIQPERRHKGKAQQVPLNIIDIRADDLRPDSTDWLKTITDKSVIPPRKANLPGGMMKRKHQITYLAAEAKAREEELQNQWASNRHSRRQTQSKYGF